MASLPLIRFRYSWHLDPLFARLFANNRNHRITEYPKPENIKEHVEIFQDGWRSVEKKLLSGMCEMLDLDFFQNAIDVHVVGYAKPFSNPLVLSSHYEADEAVDVVTHELIHRLLTDNTRQLDVGTIWSEMFAGEERLVRNHVLVHAVHEFLYREVLTDPARLDRDRSRAAKHPAYKRSWDLVGEAGYGSIIDSFKQHY